MFLEKAENFIKNINFEEIQSLFINTVYYIPIPSNYINHMLDNWMELEEDEELHWLIPSIDVLKHIIFNLSAQNGKKELNAVFWWYFKTFNT